MSYIVLNKNKIEERIKELKEQYSKLTDEHCVGHHYAVIENINFLTELVGSNIDAKEVFNAGKAWYSEKLPNGNEKLFCTYPTFLDYTKTLNI